MTLLRMAGRLLLLPGQLLLHVIARPHGKHGLPPLTRFQRGAVHGFLWIVFLMIFSMSTATPPAAIGASPTITVQRPTPAPTRPAPRSPVPPTSAPASTPPSTPVDDDPIFVPRPDNDDHRESRFCRRRWWC